MDSAVKEVAPAQPSAVKPHLGLWDIISIILGIVIGAGIYETAPLIFRNVSSPWVGLGVWVAGGVLTIIGGLCYAELASTYPRSGGDYVYLSKAFGRWAGFLFGWMQLAVLMTGSIGMMAYIFADYAVTLWRFGPASEFVYASAAVAALSLANLAGFVFGRRTQNVLTSLKVLAIGAIVVAGFFWSQPVAAKVPAIASSGGSLGLAMILVLYTYGGWNDAALVAAEVVDKRRNLRLAFMLGTGLVTVVYLLVNGAYLSGLGFEGARESKAIAADVMARPFGDLGAKVIAIFVMISALGSLNGMIYTGSRIYATLGEDHRALGWLSRWHPRRGPIFSLLAQTIIALLLVALVGTPWGRNVIDALVSQIGFARLSWEGHGGFDTLLRCTSPVFWTFFLMTSISLFVLRIKDKATPRSCPVPGYPVLPLIFCAMCGYMLYSAWDYAGKLLVIGAVPVIAGLIFYWLAGRAGVKPSSGQP